MSLAPIIDKLFYFYFLIIIIRIFLSWFPNLDWYSQPLKFISQITDPFLDIFRKIIPPIGMFDFSPIIAITVLLIVQQVVVRALVFAGL